MTRKNGNEAVDRNWLGDSEDELYKENIIDHYKHPHNFGQLNKPSMYCKENNPLCGDNIEMFIQIEESKISDIKFSGNGCALSMASASMLTDKVKGMDLQNAKSLTKEDIFKMLGVKLGVVRMKCGLLGLNALTHALNSNSKGDKK